MTWFDVLMKESIWKKETPKPQKKEDSEEDLNHYTRTLSRAEYRREIEKRMEKLRKEKKIP